MPNLHPTTRDIACNSEEFAGSISC